MSQTTTLNDGHSIKLTLQQESTISSFTDDRRNECCPSESDDEDDRGTMKLIDIISSKHQDIENTFSIISSESKVEPSKQQKEAFGGLSLLVQDNKVKNIISNVAGHGSTAIIDETLTVIQAPSTLEAKQDAFRKGVARLQTNLISNNSPAVNNPAIKLLMNVIKIDKLK